MTTQPAWLNPWRALTIDTSDVLTIVVSNVDSNKLRQSLVVKAQVLVKLQLES